MRPPSRSPIQLQELEETVEARLREDTDGYRAAIGLPRAQWDEHLSHVLTMSLSNYEIDRTVRIVCFSFLFSFFCQSVWLVKTKQFIRREAWASHVSIMLRALLKSAYKEATVGFFNHIAQLVASGRRHVKELFAAVTETASLRRRMLPSTA